jgi:hypothetical protein
VDPDAVADRRTDPAHEPKPPPVEGVTKCDQPVTFGGIRPDIPQRPRKDRTHES